MSSSEIEALFARTLIGDHDDDESWQAVTELRLNGSREVFDRAAGWCDSDDRVKRARAADILCQLQSARLPNQSVGETRWLYRDESYVLVTRMLENEQDDVVLDSAISALGHLRNAKAVALILRHAEHPVVDVRFAVAFALGCFPNDTGSVSGLLKLTRDPDAE